ncbi:ABC transporter permease [Pseudoalteromonas tunicata]|uniref:MacB-like periplasmic core domain-containing protein n=1 Tax=Pseudoalteromonas tunicata D2 TaxID=87626 RepID=A4CDW4_9GAMM|nr:ABC transporter permease [Pseudoalteromonas tunicata]ATC96351.1 hypothetical protein PTUN_a4137 [Pseudoalteromonas tunicata]AXT31849.1 hypothetical protein D1819_14180 [Pseudoalteromonas tunicata]EAR27156.1 hypothetical protein PTD2_05780 [Pseudoalteromonas tunicata D2]
MYLTYILHCFKYRKVSLLIVILSLGASFAFINSAWTIKQTLSSGKPVGVGHQGDIYSLYAYMSALDLNFLLSPSQIMSLQNQLGKQGDIIAFSGSHLRHQNLTIKQQSITAVVDIVSDNYFSALKISLGGSILNNNRFSSEQAMCVISKKFAEQYQLSVNQSINIQNKNYVIAAISERFSGLNDNQTEIWLPWQDSSQFYPPYKEKTLLTQSLNYWAVILQNDASTNQFSQAVTQLSQRVDLLNYDITPPVDTFQFQAGLSYDQGALITAKKNATVYFSIALIILVIAILNIANWLALTQAQLTSNNQLFLIYGIKKWHYFNLQLGFLAVPIALSSLLAIPFNTLYLQYLLNEGAISQLLKAGAEFNIDLNLPILFLTILASVITTLIYTQLAQRLSAVNYNTRSLYGKKSSPFALFYISITLTITVTTVCILFTSHVLQSDLPKLSLLTKEKIANLTAYTPTTHTKDQALILNERELLLQQQFFASEFGFVTYAPYFSQLKEEILTGESIEQINLKTPINKVTQNGLKLLDADLIEGTLVLTSDNQIIINEAVMRFLKSQGRSNIIGSQLYNYFGDPLQIVGIVENIAYIIGSSEQQMMVYAKDPTPTSAILLSKSQQKVTLNQTEFAAIYPVPISLTKQKQLKELPIIARVKLCLIAAILGLVISFMTIYTIATLNQQRFQQTLAIYFALGAKPIQSFIYSHRILISVSLMAITLGLILFKFASKLVPFLTAGVAFGPLQYLYTFILLSIFIAILFFISFYKNLKKNSFSLFSQ